MTPKEIAKGVTEVFCLQTWDCCADEFQVAGKKFFREWLTQDILYSTSFLLDYTGGEVLKCERELVFIDRLGQEVGEGEVVVVAKNYGEGLEICMTRGFADESRVLLESVETGSFERIALDEDNSTTKIMKMNMKLSDLAVMLKLARD